MKKILVYLLIGVLTTSVVFSNYYKSVHAMEWVAGSLSFSEALAWLLASVGITCKITDFETEFDKTRAQFWQDYEDELTQDMLDNHIDILHVNEWKEKLSKGILDKSSECWGVFKAWAHTLATRASSGSSSESVFVVGDSCQTIMTKFFNRFPQYYKSVDYRTYANTPIYACLCYLQPNSFMIQMYIQNGTYSISGSSLRYNGSTSIGEYLGFSTAASNVYKTGTQSAWYPSSGASNGFFNVSLPSSFVGSGYIDLGSVSSDGVIGDENFESAFTDDIENADILSSVIPDETDDEVSLPYPGVSDSDDAASSDAYDEIIDAINDGTITQEEGIERIQEILKIIVYDETTDDVLPNIPDDDTGENKKKDDVINENKNNMGFTLAGLENVFPFCIPFDIYAFMTLLVADPEAPEIDFPIKSVNGEVEEIHIDLSPFDSVAVVVRYIFDFLFVIGLGILTRSLIGGGSSD